MGDSVAHGMVALGRRVVAAGLVVAAGGNLAARRPGADQLLVTPMGWALDELDPSTLVGVRTDGTVVGGCERPTSELPLHLAAFTARPDADVCVHLHPPMATLLHALGLPIRRITTDHAYYLSRLGEVAFLPPGSAELADAVAAELAGADVVLLAHHGCVVVADSFDLAFSRAANLEAAAVATYRAVTLGVPVQEASGVVYGTSAGSAEGL
ncbi:MAG: class II aldolase/adducin family protein [Acidimicrobiales bacterium]